MTKAYPSNLTHAQYEFLSDMIPEAKPGGRKREVEMWDVLKAIFYVLVEGGATRFGEVGQKRCDR
ncbi:transposase [Nostoc sp. PA-18-2419]|uniref:transposase n=1 Tax=Nostoc sp. PA-18-2419 TaxID=2575443 RepID=UPI003983D510